MNFVKKIIIFFFLYTFLVTNSSIFAQEPTIITSIYLADSLALNSNFECACQEYKKIFKKEKNIFNRVIWNGFLACGISQDSVTLYSFIDELNSRGLDDQYLKFVVSKYQLKSFRSFNNHIPKYLAINPQKLSFIKALRANDSLLNFQYHAQLETKQTIKAKYEDLYTSTLLEFNSNGYPLQNELGMQIEPDSSINLNEQQLHTFTIHLIQENIEGSCRLIDSLNKFYCIDPQLTNYSKRINQSCLNLESFNQQFYRFPSLSTILCYTDSNECYIPNKSIFEIYGENALRKYLHLPSIELTKQLIKHSILNKKSNDLPFIFYTNSCVRYLGKPDPIFESLIQKSKLIKL